MGKSPTNSGSQSGNNRKILTLIITLLIIGVLFGGWYYKSTSSASDLKSKNADTTSWNKYENTSLGIQLKYPQTWILENVGTKEPDAFAIQIHPIGVDSVTLGINSEGYYSWGWRGDETNMSIVFRDEPRAIKEITDHDISKKEYLKLFFDRFSNNSNKYEFMYSTGTPVVKTLSVEDYYAYKPDAVAILETFEFVK